MENFEFPFSYHTNGLPDKVITKAGIVLYPCQNVWKLTGLKKTNLSFSDYKEAYGEKWVLNAKHVLLWYFLNKSESHAINIHIEIQNFCRLIKSDCNGDRGGNVTAQDLLFYFSSLPDNKKYKSSLTFLFFQKWLDFGLEGVESEALGFRQNLKIKGNKKGESVRTFDPLKGPFTDLERQALIEELNKKFSLFEVSLQLYLLAMVFIIFGSRTIQVSLLKCKDFQKISESHNSFYYYLNIPKAKQRNTQTWRSHFSHKPLNKDMGQLFEQHIEELKSRFSHSDILVEELPLFPDEFVGDMPKGFEFHFRPTDLHERIRNLFDSFDSVSERTKETIRVTSKRFRTTLATQAAREGHGELVIAEMLDHADTQNVGVYTAFDSEMGSRIDKATAIELAPIAQAFLGMIVTPDDNIERGDDPDAKINDPVNGDVGTCGHYGFCGALTPIACYTCINFQPWLDGPHEDILEKLLSEKERIFNITSDELISDINDRTILAVLSVVQNCRKLKGLNPYE